MLPACIHEETVLLQDTVHSLVHGLHAAVIDVEVFISMIYKNNFWLLWTRLISHFPFGVVVYDVTITSLMNVHQSQWQIIVGDCRRVPHINNCHPQGRILNCVVKHPLKILANPFIIGAWMWLYGDIITWLWILAVNYISFTIAAGLIRLHMPGVKKSRV